MRYWALVVVIVGLSTVASVHPGTANDLDFKIGEVEFKRFGKSISEISPHLPAWQINEYREAIERANGPTSCADTVATDVESSIESIDWAKIRDSYDLEVCLFFAASKTHNIQAFSDLLRSSSFRNVSIAKHSQFVTAKMGIVGEGLLLTASIPIESLPEGFGGVFGTLFAYGASLGVYLDENGMPYDVSFILTYN